MHDAPGHRLGASAAGHGLLESVHGQRGLHPAGHGAPHNPSGVEILGRTEVELALSGGVLGDVGQPQPVGLLGREVPADVAIMHGWSWTGPVLAALGPERGVPLVLVAEPPGSAGRHRSASILGLVAQQAVPELRVVLVGVVEGVRPVSGLQFSDAHRALEPAVVGLAGALEDPQGHRDRDLVGGELGHERVHLFLADSPATGRPRPGA